MRLILVLVGIVLFAAACGSGHVTQGGRALAFSHCMRANGVTKFPDPDASGQIPKTQLEHLGVSDTRFQSAGAACRHLEPNGGEPPSQTQVQQQRAQALRFAQCMRVHGVPNFPDPDSTGRIPDHGFDQGSPKFQAANNVCAKDRPPYMPSNAAYNAWARTHGG